MNTFIDEKTGTAYWLQGSDVVAAPMNKDNTYDVEDSGVVVAWESEEDEKRIKDILNK